MNNAERLHLKKLIDETECVDNTENIRKLKHSSKIRNDITAIQQLKHDKKTLKKTDPDTFAELCRTNASFLFTNYTDIFHKVCKDELNMHTLWNMLECLRQIEEGIVDQHEGSFAFGTLLKELYIDSAVRRGDNLEKEHIVEPPTYVESKEISWKQFKTENPQN
jgi:exonuclease III